MAVSDDLCGRLARFFKVLSREPAQTSVCVVDDGVERLIDLMGDRGSHLPQSCHARNMGQLHLRVVQRSFRALAFDELTYLAAHGSHRLEQVLVRLPYLVAEELHHSQDV